MARSSDWGSITACLCCASFLLGLVVLMPVLLVLYANPSWPSFTIDVFENQPINITSSQGSPNNMTINFYLKIKNKNKAIGLHYPDPIKVTFSYFPNVSMMVHLAEYTVDSFYQTKHVRELVETDGVPRVLEGTDMVAFRVDLVGTFRYKKVGTKRHKVDVGCVVVVNYTTSQKVKLGFIEMVKPGLDSQLEPPSNDVYYVY